MGEYIHEAGSEYGMAFWDVSVETANGPKTVFLVSDQLYDQTGNKAKMRF